MKKSNWKKIKKRYSKVKLMRINLVYVCKDGSDLSITVFDWSISDGPTRPALIFYWFRDACDRVSKDILWKILDKKRGKIVYIRDYPRYVWRGID